LLRPALSFALAKPELLAHFLRALLALPGGLVIGANSLRATLKKRVTALVLEWLAWFGEAKPLTYRFSSATKASV